MILGKRLSAVVDEVEGKSMADIGCDHGKVSIACLKSGKVDSVIACDISAKSLNKAIDLASRLGVEGMQFRVGDGLQVIADGEVDVVVIAGMGGNEIMSILSHIPQGVKRLVLSPHRNTIELRQFLSERGIYVERDYVVKDGKKFYDVISAIVDSGKDCKINRRQTLLGKNTDGEDFKLYLQYIQRKYDELTAKASQSQQAKLYAEMLELA